MLLDYGDVMRLIGCQATSHKPQATSITCVVAGLLLLPSLAPPQHTTPPPATIHCTANQSIPSDA